MICTFTKHHSFCGSTDEFCSTGCQTGFGGCGSVTRPSCKGGNSAAKRSVGYYESWSNTRKCQSVAPEDLNLNGFTHINFAFAFFASTTFAIAPMDGKTGYLYSRFTALKSQGVQTWYVQLYPFVKIWPLHCFCLGWSMYSQV